MTAVAALPHLDLALSEDLRHLHIVQQGTVALLVMPFNGGDQAETLGQLMETCLLYTSSKADESIPGKSKASTKVRAFHFISDALC